MTRFNYYDNRVGGEDIFEQERDSIQEADKLFELIMERNPIKDCLIGVMAEKILYVKCQTSEK